MGKAIRCVLGMDLGTSSLKCVIMDAAGRRLVSAERSYPTQSPNPRWAEQNPNDWVEAMRSALDDLRTREPRLIDGLEAIGLCSAAHIPVLLDDANRVIRPAILWSDQRSEAEVLDLRANHNQLLEDITLNEPGCTWTLPQLLWIWNHEPDVLPRVRRLLSSKDYLIFRLTDEVSMDHASAAATLMFDARNKAWSPHLTALSRTAENVFPPLVDTISIVGRITAESARAFRLPIGVPVIAGTLDSAAEMVGCGILSPGQTGMVRVGSAGGIMLVTDKRTFNSGIITYPHVVDGLFYKQAGTNACATSLKWIRDLYMTMRGANVPEVSYENLDRLAAEAKPGASGLMFHPYLQGERAPYWNPELRGSFTGIDRSHGWPQFVRAIMEGVAFSLLDCLGMFRRDGLDMTAAVMTGGVTKSQVWSQIITDVLGMDTWTIRDGDSALGVCMLSATAVGMFASIDDAVSACVSQKRTMEFNPANRDRYDRLFARYQETGRFLDTMARKFSAGSV